MDYGKGGQLNNRRKENKGCLPEKNLKGVLKKFAQQKGLHLLM
jgi:hypothetical protein